MSTLSRRHVRPWLMFVGPEVEGSSGDASLTAEQFREKYGYPTGTSTDDMNDGEKAAYWRRKSKSFQKDAEAKERELGQWKGLGEFDAVSTTVQTAEQVRQQSLTDAQRAQEAAQQAETAARVAGETAGAAKYLGPAVQSSLVALTLRPGEKAEDATKRVKDALEFVDVNRFVDEQGEIDPARLDTFAKSLGSGGATNDPLAALMQRQTTPAPGSGGSVGEMRTRTRDRLKKKQ